jgi:nucleoside-diphosphate-sugar epimerase
MQGLEVRHGDLLDRDALARLLKGATGVVHLAAKNVDRDGSGFHSINVEGTEQLARAAAAAGVERFVYVSTVGVYGHGEHHEAVETTAVRPDTAFSSSKAAAERIVLRHHRAGSFASVILRHRFVYGEGDESVVPRLIRAARKYPFWIGGGRARLSFVLAQDFAEVVYRFLGEASAAPGPGDPVYHVTSGESLSNRQILKTICDAFGYTPPRFSVPLWLLLGPLALRERLLGLDPESVDGISSLRLKLVARSNTFSNRRLLERFPDLVLTPFAEGFRQSLSYYRRFA